MFNLYPKKKKELKVCEGKSCTRNHCKDIIKNAKKARNVSVRTSSCMGLCSMAPTVVLDGKTVSNVNPSKIGELLGEDAGPIQNGPPAMDDPSFESISDLLDI